jgi:hypothetical protein
LDVSQKKPDTPIEVKPEEVKIMKLAVAKVDANQRQRPMN